LNRIEYCPLKTNKQITGDRGEQIAVDFLEREGYEIVARNWRHRRSEIDIIARLGKILIFIEVKTLRDDTQGPPEDRINTRKLQLLFDGASVFMEINNHPGEIRIDFIAIYLKEETSFEIRHIPDAYWPA